MFGKRSMHASNYDILQACSFFAHLISNDIKPKNGECVHYLTPLLPSKIKVNIHKFFENSIFCIPCMEYGIAESDQTP